MKALRSSYPIGQAELIAHEARRALELEVRTFPKPGLVSHVDQGAHPDMDQALLEKSARVLEPYFADLAEAGAAVAPMGRLRVIGIAAEQAMLAATGGINTHRGAIFGMGLLCAAAGFRDRFGQAQTLGEVVVALWRTDIRHGPVPLRSHGADVARWHGAGGARQEAADGFPSLHGLAIPALAEGERRAPGDPEAARVHACMVLIASVCDTNLLYRGGAEGLAFAQAQARLFIERGSVGDPHWRTRAQTIHEAFVTRRLSPGGCADLLAMAIFAQAVGP